MTGLLRADWIRFRRRYDLWIVLLAVVLLGVLAYWSGAGSANSPALVEPIDPSFPPEIRAQIEAQNAMFAAQAAAMRDLYVFPRSVVTMLTQGSWLFMAAAFVTASWIATEFDWGTLRNVLLVEPRRGRFLAARIVALIAVSAVALVALAGLGAVMPLLVPVVGSGGPSGVTLGAIALTAAGGLTWCIAFTAAAALAAVVTRSPILALILTYGYFLLEALVDNLPVWHSSGPPLEWVPQFLLGLRLNVLTGDVGAATGLRQPFEGERVIPPIHLDPPVGLAVIAAWIVFLLLAAGAVLRRADIGE